MEAIAGDAQVWATAGMAAVALAALAWRCGNAASPGQALARVGADLAVGTGWVMAVNLLLSPLGAHVGWNPGTAWLAGSLGLPGAAALAALALIAGWSP